jgi:hypothetical protein
MCVFNCVVVGVGASSGDSYTVGQAICPAIVLLVIPLGLALSSIISCFILATVGGLHRIVHRFISYALFGRIEIVV